MILQQWKTEITNLILVIHPVILIRIDVLAQNICQSRQQQKNQQEDLHDALMSLQ